MRVLLDVCDRVPQSVRTAFQDLLTLWLNRAEHDVVIAKVQEIEPLLELF